ncbi:MAG: ABC transporter permease [Bacilli bacterium]|nr:ABC transporter permease [Bacilli bacterium]
MKKVNPYIKKRRINQLIIVSIQLSLLVLFIAVWELLSKHHIIDNFLFSKPSSIFELLKSYIQNGELWKHIKISTLETILGLVIGTALGLIIAIILWWNEFIARIFDPFLVVLNALPKTALAPILIIWAGTGIRGITVVAVSISIVITIISGYAYFKNIEEDKIKMLKSFGANKWQILIKLVLPANFANIVNIIKINIGMSWIGVIVGEFVVSRAGIGYLIVYGSQVFKMDLVMMGVLVLAIIAFVMYEIVNIIELQIKRKRK